MFMHGPTGVEGEHISGSIALWISNKGQKFCFENFIFLAHKIIKLEKRLKRFSEFMIAVEG